MPTVGSDSEDTPANRAKITELEDRLKIEDELQKAAQELLKQKKNDIERIIKEIESQIEDSAQKKQELRNHLEHARETEVTKLLEAQQQQARELEEAYRPALSATLTLATMHPLGDTKSPYDRAFPKAAPDGTVKIDWYKSVHYALKETTSLRNTGKRLRDTMSKRLDLGTDDKELPTEMLVDRFLARFDAPPGQQSVDDLLQTLLTQARFDQKLSMNLLNRLATYFADCGTMTFGPFGSESKQCAEAINRYMSKPGTYCTEAHIKAYLIEAKRPDSELWRAVTDEMEETNEQTTDAFDRLRKGLKDTPV